MDETTLTKDIENKTLTIERVISAPVDRVWHAWTDAAMFAKWWGPRGWQTTVKQMDVTPGGTLLYGMKCEDENQGEWFGQESWGKAVYQSIDEPREFTYIDYFCDAEGTVNETMPSTTNTVTFTPEDGKTRLRSSSVFATEADMNTVLEMGVEQGVKETWDRLEEQALAHAAMHADADPDAGHPDPAAH